MALQFVVKFSGRLPQLAARMSQIDGHIEVFGLEGEEFGVSVPTKVVDRLGEATLRDSLSEYAHYDLWSGRWHEPKAKARGLLHRWLQKG